MSLKELEPKPEIIKLELLVRKFLQENPPTLGHGYSHLKKVARIAFQLAIENDLGSLEIAYVSGFLHDLYRPALGEAGQEKHEERTAMEARLILQQTPYSNQAEEIIGAILNHDEIIQEGTSTPLMEILSLADKADMSFQRAVAYSWASNRALKGKGKIAYTTFIKTMGDFCLYQVKAWRVFLAVKSQGVLLAAEAYMKTNEDLMVAVRREINGEVNYQEESLDIAKKEAKQERGYLEEASATQDEINQITQNFSELIEK